MAPPRQTSFREIAARGRHLYLKCEICESTQNQFLRDCGECDTEGLCLDCFKTNTCCKIKEEIAKARKQKTTKNESSSSSSVFNFSTIITIAILVFVAAYIIPKFLNNRNSNSLETISKEELMRNIIRDLRNKFPNQKKEVWGNIRHVVSGCLPVTTLTFLYKDDPATADCLAQHLAYSYAEIQNRSFSQESIFRNREVSDYGIILEEYGLKIERTNLLVVKGLHELPGSVAKIFHTLCDSYAPRVNPSVFIFTLR